MRNLSVFFIFAGLFSSVLSLAAEPQIDPVRLSHALKEIENMPLEVCRAALILNQNFYLATEGHSEHKRRDYFGKFRREMVDRGYPTPRLPPPPGSPIDVALLRRCGIPSN